MRIGDILNGERLEVDSGVYLIYAEGVVLYVGKNVQITNRLRHGHKNRNTPLWQAIQAELPASLEWDVRVETVESDDPQLLQYRTRAREAELIRKHEPPLNVAYNPAAWAENKRT